MKHPNMLPPVGSRRSRRPRPPGPVRAVKVDSLLSEWRASRPGSYVAYGSYGVRLCAGIGQEPLTFTDTEAALEWATRP